jgi:hypothetical protein
MFDFGTKIYDKEAEKAKRKLRDAWEKFYTPMQLSRVKFRIKVNERMRKGKFPVVRIN